MLKTIALTTNTPNKNNRVYPKYVVENALIKAQDMVNNDKLFVTSEFPKTGTVNLQNVVGVIKNIFLDENDLVVEVQFFDNKLGNIFEQQLKNGRVALRPSGIGTLQQNDRGKNVLNEDYEITCFSITDDPA